MVKRKKILYITDTSASSADGVFHKIQGFVSAAKKLGYEAESSFKGRGTNTFTHFMNIMATDAGTIVVRNISGWMMAALIPYFLVARLQGKNLIVDIPTPIQVNINEIRISNKTRWARYRHIAYLYLNGPVPYWFFNKIIEYGREARFFLWGNRKKVVFLSNGIDVERVTFRKKKQNTEALVLVGVANVADYHGYDRVVRAIATWRKYSKGRDVYFHIIGGEGNEGQKRLKKLVQTEGLEYYVLFHDNKGPSFVNAYYSAADLGVGSLALFRIGLMEASPLKHREFALAGLPFISAGYDSDFPATLPFNFVISNDNEIGDLINIFKTFEDQRKLFTNEEIREYCIQHCSFETKLRQIGF